MKLKFSILIFLIICQVILWAQGDIYTKFTKKDGLSSADVYCMFQDEKGLMWIGTVNGLDVYDGIRFFNYNNLPNCKLPSAPVTQILKDSDGKMWVVNGSQLGVFDPVSLRYTPVSIKSSKPLKIITTGFFTSDFYLWKDKAGNLFLNILHQMVLAYDKANNYFTDKILPFKLPDNCTVNKVMQENGNGRYWMATDSGFAFYDAGRQMLCSRHFNPENNGMLSAKDFEMNQPVDMIIDATGTFWIWAKTPSNAIKVYKYSPVSQKLLDITSLINGDLYGFYFFNQKNGNIWLYGPHILLTCNPDKNSFDNNHFIRPEDHNSDYRGVNQVFEDRESNLWFATDGGLFFHPNHHSEIVKINSPYKTNLEILSLIKSRQGNILVGTWQQGIKILDSSYNWTSKKLSLPNDTAQKNYNNIWCLYQTRKTGQIWAGCQRGYVIVLDSTESKVIIITSNLFNNSTISKITEEENGTLWFANYKGGIFNKPPGDEKGSLNIKMVQNLNAEISAFYMDDKTSLLWIGTVGNGVYILNTRTKNIVYHYLHDNTSRFSLHDNKIYDIHQYNDSIFLIISEAINILNTRTGIVKNISGKDLPFNIISRKFKSLMDQDRNLWMITTDGIYKYDYFNNRFSEFHSDEGFPETNKSTTVSYAAPDGTLLFGGTDNILVFHPKQTDSKAVPPDVTITRFSLFNEFLNTDSVLKLKEVQLDHNQNSFSVYFSSVTFNQRNHLNYYYQLEGVDKEWIKANELAYCSYTALPPGHYKLWLKCSNIDGINAANITGLTIYIQPPFWNTWWFRTLSGMLVLVLIYYVHRLRINKIMAVQKMRSKVARDLHDDVGSTLTTIGILSEMAKAKVNGNKESYDLITKISDHSSLMMESMSDIVWSINPGNDNLEKIIIRMREYAVTTLEAKNIEFLFNTDLYIPDLKLGIDAKLDFFLIFKEAVNNLVKYSGCSFVKINIYNNGKKLVMNIKDNGKGFDIKNHKKGNGLGNMRKRAEQIGATLEIKSISREGTDLLLQIPTD